MKRLLIFILVAMVALVLGVGGGHFRGKKLPGKACSREPGRSGFCTGAGGPLGRLYGEPCG